MRKIFLSLVVLVAACVSAQVKSDPAIIDKGYAGQIILTFDPALGTGGMVNATECYSHIGLLTSESGTASDWKYVREPDGWGTKTEPQWTKVGTKWQLVIPSIYTFFNCPETTDIVAIVMVFHDGKGSSSKQGKATGDRDIVLYLGEENDSGDIWENFTPAPQPIGKRPAGIKPGITYHEDGTSVTLCAYIASKFQPANHVYVLGDFSDWKLDNNLQMTRDGNYFWYTLTGLEPGREYCFQYAVERFDGVKKQICDIYSEKVLHPHDEYEPSALDPSLHPYPKKGADGGYVTVIQPGKEQFEWSDATLNFQRPDKNNLIIYELWVYDHTPDRSLRGLYERLDYLKNLGVNAVELMPINEFEGNQSWGYNPTLYFALDKAYGTPNDLKWFVDGCHQRGIAVILDMVFNHTTGLNPMAKLYPWGDELKLNPWFNVSSAVPHKDNNFGEDWNHDFSETHEMFTRVLQYWIQEYKVDGYRLDLSHGICGTTRNPVANLKDYYQKGVQAADNKHDAYLILEHWESGDWPALTAAGMLPWAKYIHPFAQIAMGYDSESNIAGASQDGYISYSESHDEERNFAKVKLWGAGNLASDEDARVSRAPLVLGLLSMLNGSKMFYHYEEIGYDYSKFQNAKGEWGKDNEDEYKGGSSYGNPQPKINEDVKMQPKYRPEEWIKNEGARMDAYRKVGQIFQLRTRILPNVFAGDPTEIHVSSGDIRTIQWGSHVYVAGNMSATQAQNITLPSGSWYDYLDGGVPATSNYSLQPGEIKVFTGSKITPPDVPSSYGTLGVENINTTNESAAYKILRNGQVLIVRGDNVYTITGTRVQ